MSCRILRNWQLIQIRLVDWKLHGGNTMRYQNVLLCLTTTLFLFSCNLDTKDDLPPEVSILSPANGSTVSGIVLISCVASDESGIDHLELFVDGVSTSMTDDDIPFSFDWNTFQLEDSTSHVLTVQAIDNSGNLAESDAVNLNVNNAAYYPMAVVLGPVVYENNAFSITWTENEDLDFHSYHIFESQTSDVDDMIEIYSTEERSDTSFSYPIIRNEIRFFAVTIDDSIGLSTLSNVEQGNSFQFNCTFGGSERDEGFSVVHSQDGGYVVVGATGSFGSGQSEV